MLIDTEDKLLWCEKGAAEEKVFCMLFGHMFGLKVNPEKKVDPYAIDLIHKTGRPCELKKRCTPFFTAYKSYGVPVQHAVTINRNDVHRYYTDYPQLPLYFWVDWQQLEWQDIKVKPMRGVWGIRIEQLHDLCTPDRLHTYQRRVDDTAGNAKDSYVVSLEDMKQLWPR